VTAPAPFRPEGIPPELRDLPHWVEARDKEPYNARTGDRASTTNPKTWSSFDQAVAAATKRGHQHIGFVFSTGDDYVGIDVDHCRDQETGTVDERALLIVRTLDSYTEVSSSGTGLHIIVKGSLPAEGRVGTFEGMKVEIYPDGRHFVMTGHQLDGTPPTINQRTRALRFVHAAVCGGKAKVEPKATRASQPVDLDDRELLERMFAAKNGAEIRALWDGSTAAHGNDSSSADQALCNHLAFWAGRDAARMDRLFRQSGLYRDKWDKPARKGETYGAGTIRVAIEGCNETYSGPACDGVDLGEALSNPQPGGCCGGCACDCCTRRRPQLERAYAASRQHVSAMTTIRKSTALSGKHKSVAEALLLTVEQARRRGKSEAMIFYGDRTARKEGRDPGGLARDGGTSPSTVGTLVEELRKHEAASPYRFETIEGENGLPRVVVKFNPNSTMLDDAAAIAGLEREKAQHGGSRVVCPDHPTAPLIRTTACAECGQIVDSQTLNADRESAGSKLLQAIATAHRRGSTKGLRLATSEPPRRPTGPLLHDATGSPNGHARANGSTNGHHPPPPSPEPLRATPLEIIELLQAKYGPSVEQNGAAP
jgi:putative DNA primase/helicase